MRDDRWISRTRILNEIKFLGEDNFPIFFPTKSHTLQLFLGKKTGRIINLYFIQVTTGN